jgi:ATP-dependent RNA helicase RhlE
MSFTSFGLHPDLLRAITDLEYVKPTPIQDDAIPPGLAGRDVLACAMTGSGKTAAFLLPIMQRLLGQPRGTTRVLILAPTRELAAQILESFESLAKYTELTGAAVFGGVAMGPQEKAFRRGVDVLVATPGRLLDHFQSPYARLEGLEILVIDEADRMLDMGFLPDIRRVLQHLPERQQTFFFSATLPPPIVALSRELLKSPVALNVERQALPATGVTQAVYAVREDLKPWLLLELLRRGEIKNVLVFTRTKHRANRLAEFLSRHGVECDRIHGNRSQAQRTEALARFKDGRNPVLVATDIAARGIDVEALSHVVNFDVPHVPEDYIHRVGRTARAEMTGDAFTFVAPSEQGELAAIERAVGTRLPRLTLAGFDYEKKPEERFEIPIAERIAAIRARKAEERARAREKAERKAQRGGQEQTRGGQPQTARPARQGPPRRGHQDPGQRPPAQPVERDGNRAGYGGHAGHAGGSGHAGYGNTNPWPGAARASERRHGGGPGPRGKHPRGAGASHRPAPVPEREPEIPKDPAERASQIASTFNPSRFNRFRR